MATYLATFFGDRGYDVQLQEVEPGRFQTIATLRGSGGGQSLMLNGHMDIDPLAFGLVRDPWVPSWEGDNLYGGGSNNMKGGLTSIITAAEAIRKSGIEMKGDLVVACVAGELQGGVGTTYALRNGLKTDAAIVAEPVGDGDNIITTHVGWVEMAISTIGLSQHVSRSHLAIDAIDMMIKAIPAIKNVQFTHTPRADLPTCHASSSAPSSAAGARTTTCGAPTSPATTARSSPTSARCPARPPRWSSQM